MKMCAAILWQLVALTYISAEAIEQMAIKLHTGGNATGPPIVIATSLPIDCCSKYSDYGRAMRQNYEMMIEWISENRGGVRLAGPQSTPRPLVVEIYNDYSDPELVEDIYNHLINDVGHRILFGTYSSGLAKVAANIVNQTDAVMLAPCSASPSVFIDRPNVYSTITPSSKYLVGPIEASSHLATTVAYAFESPSFTRSMCAIIPGVAQTSSLQITRSIELSDKPSRSEVRAALQSLKDNPPDMFVGCVYKDACVLFMEEISALKLDIKTTLLSSCGTQEFASVGAQSKYVVGMSPWLSTFTLHSQVTNRTVSDFVTKYIDRYDEHPNYQGMSAQMSLLSFVEAIEAAQSTDPSAVSAQLRTLNMETIFGQISFDENGQGQNPFKGVQVFQSNDQGVDLRVVSPVNSSQSLLIFPMPSWSERECLEAASTNRKGISENGTCVECAPGHVSVWNSSASFLQCMPCTAGTHPGFNYQGKYECILCQAGSAGGSSAMASCKQCGLGRFANTSGQTQCHACPVGRAASEEGSFQCSPCTPGTAAVSLQAVECTRCEIGKFMPSRSASTCTSCPEGLVTRSVGAVLHSECVCPRGSYLTLMNTSGAIKMCTKCPKQLICETGTVDPLLGDTSVIELGVFPKLNSGYWSSSQDPLSIYRCLDKVACPGGEPGTCGQHREGLACAKCESGYYESGKSCAKCNAFDNSGLIFPWLPLLVGPGIIMTKYRWSLDPVDDWGSWQNEGSTIVFILIRICQMLGSIQKVPVEWPETIVAIFFPWRNVFAPEDLLRPDCMGMSFGEQFLLQVTLPLLLAGIFVLTFALARIAWCAGLTSLKVDINIFYSVLMSGLLVFYITITSISLSLFKCYEHPNGEWSLTVAAEILCYRGEWNSYVGLALMAITVYVVSLTSFLAYVCYVAPRNFSNPLFQQRFKFLFIKFKAAVWWWMLPLMLQGVALMFAHALLVRPVMQYAWSMVVLLFYIGFSVTFEPWRHCFSNKFDFAGCGVVLFTAGLALWYAGRTTSLDSGESDILVAFVSFLPLVVAMAKLCHLAWDNTSQDRRALQEDKRQLYFKHVASLLKNYADVKLEKLNDLVNRLSLLDLEALREAYKVILAEHEGKQLSRRLSDQRLITGEQVHKLAGSTDGFEQVVCIQGEIAIT